MKKTVKFILLLFVIVLLSGCDYNIFKKNNSYMQEINYKEYLKLLENDETFILEVMRTNCTACTSFKPKITQVANDYKVVVKFIDTDKLSDEDKNALFEKANVSATPTVIFYNKGFEETMSTRINGSVSVDKIIAKFKINGFIKEENK